VIDLTERAGFPVSLDLETGELHFGEGVATEAGGARTVGELADVLAFPDAAASREDESAYLLYRGVRVASGESVLTARGLRYDLTVTLPGDMGSELIKTAGHIHSLAPDGVGYPEIYDVLHGQAAFLLQFRDPLRVAIAMCGAGERILIPPGASHLTVNTGWEPLVVADLVAIASQNDYGEFRERRGAAVYLVCDGDSWAERINPRYPTRPIWTVQDGSRIGDFAPGTGPIYSDAMANPGDYGWLTAPASRAAEMLALWQFADPQQHGTGALKPTNSGI
jgi:glucose-6-phosphate isomerase